MGVSQLGRASATAARRIRAGRLMVALADSVVWRMLQAGAGGVEALRYRARSHFLT